MTMHYQVKSTKACILFHQSRKSPLDFEEGQYQTLCQTEMRWKVFLFLKQEFGTY